MLRIFKEEGERNSNNTTMSFGGKTTVQGGTQ
jgi:hypothetical protein